MEYLIFNKDISCEKHRVIVDLFNYYFETNKLLEVLGYASNGGGYGDDHIGITFWDDLDEFGRSFYTEKFEGIEVEFVGEVIVIDFESFYKYTKIALQKYLYKNPEEKDKVEIILKNMRNTFDIANCN